MNIIEKMIEDRVASNPLHAARIANGLHLAELGSDQEKIDRYKLYRRWRDAGESPRVSYANAIAGTEPLELQLHHK